MDLIKELKKDPQLREAYKANIAMAFKDNFRWHKEKTGMKIPTKEDLHTIANNSADYFLDLLIK